MTILSSDPLGLEATYDGLGRCVRRTVGGVTRLFTYDDWKPFMEWDGAGHWVAWNMSSKSSRWIATKLQG